MSTVLVTGATGNVGSRLVNRLVKKGARVRALVRDPKKAKLPPGVEAVQGDLTDPASLKSAVAGASRLFLLSAGIELDQLEARIIAAAAAAKVEHIVKQSTQGAQYADYGGPLFAKWHRASEKRIEDSGAAFTFLRPSSIATNALEWKNMINNGGAVYGPYGNTALPIIDPDDIAAVAEVALTQAGHAGKAYDLTGPEALTAAEQVAIVSKVIGRPVKFVDVPDEQGRQAMLGMGVPPRFVDAIIDLAQALKKLGKVPASTTVPDLLGRPARSFEQFIRDNAGVFAQ